MNKNYTLFNILKNHKWDEFIKIINDDINNEINVNIVDEANNYLIQYSILFNKKEIVSLLINKGAKLDIIDSDGRSILFIPIKFNFTDILELLLHFNSSSIGLNIIDLKDKYGDYPIHYCLLFNDIESFKLLLKNNVDLNLVNNDKLTPLHYSIYKKNIDIIKLIIENNINLDARTNTGETALHYACNFQLYDVVKLLLEKGADPNIQDYEHEITPLMYCIILRNKKFIEILLKYKADINLQDYYGNSPLHYLINENDVELFDYFIKFKPNVNLYNAENKLPIHIALEKFNNNTYHFVKHLIEKSNLNLQNHIGNTSLHLLIVNDVWEQNIDLLEKKELNIYLKNKNNKTILDYIDDSKKNKFIDLVVKSFLWNLKKNKNILSLDWEKKCVDYEKNKDCFDISKKFILENKISLPIIKKKEINLEINNKICISFSSFTGVTLDVLVGLLYLLNKHNNICSTLTEEFNKNDKLNKFYNKIGLQNNNLTDYLNFEIIWSFYKIFYPNDFDKEFLKCKNNTNVRFIIIPLGIELYNGNHANYILYDTKNNEIERFEPNGANNPYKLNYNPDMLDSILENKFKSIINDIIYIRPKNYLPKIGFQTIDAMETSKFKKIGDPGGFCVSWSIWYVDMRINNSEIDRKILVKSIITKIKKFNYSFKNIIRNYSSNITNYRDEILKEGNIDINDWLNEKFNNDQLTNINNKIKKIIKNSNEKRKKPILKRINIKPNKIKFISL